MSETIHHQKFTIFPKNVPRWSKIILVSYFCNHFHVNILIFLLSFLRMWFLLLLLLSLKYCKLKVQKIKLLNALLISHLSELVKRNVRFECDLSLNIALWMKPTWKQIVEILTSDSHFSNELFYFLLWKPFKMMKNAFYFILKALFLFKIFKFFVLTFWSCKKTGWLERKINFRIHNITTWLVNNCNTHIAHYLTKGKQPDNEIW